MRIHATLGFALLAALSCDNAPTGGEEQQPTGLPPGGGQGCRDYATEWLTSVTVTGRQPITASAQFAPSTLVYSARSPAQTGPEYMRLTYWSSADFIDEGAVMARFLFRRADRCSQGDCRDFSTELPAYDDQRRMKTLTLMLRNGFPVYVENFTRWDSVGRPIAGTRTTAVCTETLIISYDDVARTFEKGPQYTGPGLCGLSGFQRLTFDQHNNVVAEYVATGGASTTWTHSITSSTPFCKPD